MIFPPSAIIIRLRYLFFPRLPLLYVCDIFNYGLSFPSLRDLAGSSVVAGLVLFGCLHLFLLFYVPVVCSPSKSVLHFDSVLVLELLVFANLCC